MLPSLRTPAALLLLALACAGCSSNNEASSFTTGPVTGCSFSLTFDGSPASTLMRPDITALYSSIEGDRVGDLIKQDSDAVAQPTTVDGRKAWTFVMKQPDNSGLLAKGLVIAGPGEGFTGVTVKATPEQWKSHPELEKVFPSVHLKDSPDLSTVSSLGPTP